MRKRAIGFLVCAVCVLGLAGLAWAQAQPPAEVAVKPFDWPSDSTFEFGIFDQNGGRIATAYYRILKEEIQGKSAYRLKYVGRNEQTSEASECWIDPQSLLPLRSTRKLVSGGRTFYLDVAYGTGTIVVRRKYEGEEATQQEMPAHANMYDYESLIWLIPQLDFGGNPQARINLFDTLNYAATTVVIQDLGTDQIEIKGAQYPAHRYQFEVSLTPYQYWTVLQNGRATPARFDPGSNSFINLGLDPKKITDKPAAPAKPKPAKPKPQDKGEGKSDGDAGGNPLGPPPPGSRF